MTQTTIQPTGYSPLQIALHWAILLLIAVNYFTGEYMTRAFDGFYEEQADATSWQSSVHVWFGTAILLLVAVRFVVRLVNGAPPHAEETSGLMILAGKVNHALLYVLLVAVPVLGLLAWFGGLTGLGDYHVLLMNLMLVLAGLHAAAAIFHQYVMKDGLLMRMVRPS